MAVAVIDGKEFDIVDYDLTPRGIHKYLKLDVVNYKETCTWGHFGRGFEWE
jgi:S-adenosylmethionine synthetase